MYIFEGIYKQDITREFYGLKGVAFKNRPGDVLKILKHPHRNPTMRYMLRNCIGPLNIPELIQGTENFKTEISMTSMNFQKMNENFSIQEKEILDKIYYWKKQNEFDLGNNMSI